MDIHVLMLTCSYVQVDYDIVRTLLVYGQSGSSLGCVCLVTLLDVLQMLSSTALRKFTVIMM